MAALPDVPITFDDQQNTCTIVAPARISESDVRSWAAKLGYPHLWLVYDVGGDVSHLQRRLQLISDRVEIIKIMIKIADIRSRASKRYIFRERP